MLKLNLVLMKFNYTNWLIIDVDNNATKRIYLLSFPYFFLHIGVYFYMLSKFGIAYYLV